MSSRDERRNQLQAEFEDDPAGFFRRFVTAIRCTAGGRPKSTWISAVIDFIIDAEEEGHIVTRSGKSTPEVSAELSTPTDQTAVC